MQHPPSQAGQTAMLKALYKEILDTFDRLPTSTQPDDIRQMLESINRLFSQLFRFEQKLHDESGYSNSAQHKYHHNNYLYTYKRIQEEFWKNDLTTENLLELSKSMSSWFMEHIRDHDSDFFQYYQTFLQQQNNG